MKKSWIPAVLLTVAMVFSFSGCGSSESGESSSSEFDIVDELSVEPDVQNEKEQDAEKDNSANQDEEQSANGQSTSETSGTSSPSQSSGTHSSSSSSGKSSGTSSSSGSSGGSGSSSHSSSSSSGGGAVTSTPAAQPSGGSDGAAAPQPSASTARSYIGSSASALIAAIGSPTSSQYSPSCMGDGDDGELYYGGFTVYTYRENGQEQVVDVE